MIAVADMQSYNLKTLDPSFRGVVFNYLGPVSYDNLIDRNNFTFRICKEVLITNSFVFYFTKNFYLVNEFDQLIQNFESAGLIDHIRTKYIQMDSMETIRKNPPTALTYRNIEGFFALYYLGCFLALLSFVCEVLFAYRKKRSNLA